jgi:heparosan-N-sulfate-glucuronate 5-epimerase
MSRGKHSDPHDERARTLARGQQATEMAVNNPLATAGFFSSAKRLTLPLGPALDSERVRGYPIDMRAKAHTAEWPPHFDTALEGHFVPLIQFGLGCFERFLAGEGEIWLQTALAVGRFLIASQEPDGSWLNRRPFRHTFLMPPRWRCGMAQGEAASLLVRLYLEVGDPALAESAHQALKPLFRPPAEGGVCARLDGAPWPEEYPTNPPSMVLNGAIFAWWGVRDVAVGLADTDAARAFREGVDGLAANLARFDTGSWSLYCLHRYPVAPVASSFYHVLHITQLEAMHALAPRAAFSDTRERWIAYLDSPWLRSRALSRKILFRLVVPRNRLLARAPWAARA